MDTYIQGKMSDPYSVKNYIIHFVWVGVYVCVCLVSLGLVWFYSISTIVGYSMANPFVYI